MMVMGTMPVSTMTMPPIPVTVQGVVAVIIITIAVDMPTATPQQAW